MPSHVTLNRDLWGGGISIASHVSERPLSRNHCCHFCVQMMHLLAIGGREEFTPSRAERIFPQWPTGSFVISEYDPLIPLPNVSLLDSRR